MSDTTILLVVSDAQLGELLERGVLIPAGYQVSRVDDISTVPAFIRSSPASVLIVESTVGENGGYQFAQQLLEEFPALSVIIIETTDRKDAHLATLRAGASECLMPPLKPEDVLAAVKRSVERLEQLVLWAKERGRRDTDMLRRRVNILETLGKVGRSVTASLDLDDVLRMVVDACVEITEAEEGSLLILDEESGELYMRAARNFQDEFVRTFRLPISDTLAGEVIRTGTPILLDEGSPQKIKTSYLVKTLIYVPLKIHGRVIGVLGVDNRESERSFHPQHLTLVSALADYAAIAIENARLFSDTEVERNKLEQILTQIEDGVIVVDTNGSLLLANRVACELLNVDERDILMQPVDEIFENKQLLELLKEGYETFPYRSEIELDDNRVLNAQLNIIPNVGLAVTMHDVTYFKELDRIKSEFVSAVSHDLRSPLTAILGYVELLERVGPLNERQEKFIQRVQVSVRAITELVNDLLDLGRIESGLDDRKELVALVGIVQYSVENVQNFIQKNNLKVVVDIPEDLPKVFGDSIRLRQVFDNLIGNAIRYTPQGGQISIIAHEENDQVIIRFIDTGLGIPVAERPHIFDKFFRASNVAEEIPGSGLGLAIVKSIVDNHQGRIWVDSIEGEGSTFTVVLPIEHEV